MKKIFYLLVGVIILAMMASLLFSDNINSIEGDFQELAFVRNENNTGPVHRLYAYQVKDTLWSNIQQHATLLPHTKYGVTEVYYFLPEQATVTVSELNINDSKLSTFEKEQCIAYIKVNGMGVLTIDKFPFKSL